MNTSEVTVITVTYGNRRHLLEPILRAVIKEPFANIIVVNNGAEWDIHAFIQQLKNDAISIVDMGENTGSAQGFASGIQQAMNEGAHYIWLLDDDNRPLDGALQALISQYMKLRQEIPEESLALLSYRPAQQVILASGEPLKFVNPRNSCFHGFHVLDIPQKIRRRTFFGAMSFRAYTPEIISLNAAPYGGLFVSRKLIQKIGLPRTDFVLYEDDTEYTYRITNNGGKIYLVVASIIEDVETAWNASHRFRNSFAALLCGEGDFKAFYNMRNCTFLDEHIRKKNIIIFTANKAFYILILIFFSIIHKKYKRLNILLTAIKDGKNKTLGIKEGISLHYDVASNHREKNPDA